MPDGCSEKVGALIPGAPAQRTRAELERWDDQFLWHPFTPHSVYRDEEPLLFVGGEGNELIDADGRRYVDGVASLWCNLLGHGREEINRAIIEQLGRIAHSTLLGHTQPLAIELARRLIEISPQPLTRVFFSDNGSTAVEVALKIAFQYWKQQGEEDRLARQRFLTFHHSYHGDTIGSVSVGNINLYHGRYGGLLFETVVAPSPYVYRSPFGNTSEAVAEGCLAEMGRLVDRCGDTLAAVLIEPGFQGAAGIIPQPPGFLRRVGEITRAAGALLIFDEVAVGFGRSGAMFACQREGVTPDLLCLAKGLTGGYLPMAATLATEEVFSAFLGPPADGRTFFHGHTYSGNQLGAAAALATLDILQREKVLERVSEKIEYLAQQLERVRSLPGVGDVRQYGLAAGIELVADRESKAPFPADERRGMRVCRAAREHGVFLRPLGDVIVVMPPLSITRPQLAQIVEAIADGIGRVCAGARGW